MTTTSAFTLRPLERRTPAGALEGGFRVHLSIKELKNLGLSVGDLCRLTTTSGASGYAVAWLSQETNPGNKPIAKVTELLRETYGFPLTERVFIEKANDAWKPADTVSITLVDTSQAQEDIEYWADHALGEVNFLFAPQKSD